MCKFIPLLASGLLAIACGTGCGWLDVKDLGQKMKIVDPDTPDSPDEAVFRRQLAVLAEANSVVAAVRNQTMKSDAANVQLKQIKERLRDIQQGYQPSANGINDFRPSLRFKYTSLIGSLNDNRALVAWDNFRRGDQNLLDFHQEIGEIMDHVGPPKRQP
jgi:hypothetical protein